MDGDCYEGTEDHVWMDGKQISFGIREPYHIIQIESYELPSDDDMIMQAVDQMICEVCMFNEHCYMEMCIASLSSKPTLFYYQFYY